MHKGGQATKRLSDMNAANKRQDTLRFALENASPVFSLAPDHK